jgi:hypothetical protein
MYLGAFLEACGTFTAVRMNVLSVLNVGCNTDLAPVNMRMSRCTYTLLPRDGSRFQGFESYIWAYFDISRNFPCLVRGRCMQ